MYSSSSSSSKSSSTSSSTSSKSKSSLSTSSVSHSYSSSSSSESSSISRSSLSHSSLSSGSRSSSSSSSTSTEIRSSFSSSSSSSTEIKSSSSSSSLSTEIKTSSSTEYMSSSSSTEEMTSSTSSTSSSMIDLEHEVIVAMACRDYGEGRILIHTDRIGAYFTGHGNNSNELWRKILEWTAKKRSNELIRIGLINSTEQDLLNKIKEISFVSVEDIKLQDFSYIDLSDYDCLYFAGLPISISLSITYEIKEFVENGKGLLIEYPNTSSQNINVLRDIENIECYSSERLILTNAYWTIDGGNHYIYNDPVEISFMSTLRQEDFSENWTILMSNIPNVVTTTTTTGNGSIFDFNLSSGSEFVISFISSMQNGIVEIEEDVSTSSSSESSFIGTSESTLSSYSSESSTDSSSTSSDYFDLIWTKYDNTIPTASNTTSTNGRLARGASGGDSGGVSHPCVIKDGDVYKMWYSSPSLNTIYYATSTDGLTWTKYNNATETSSDHVGHDGRMPKGSSGADNSQIGYPCVIKDGSVYKMWYSGSNNGTNWRIFHAYSYDGLTWIKYDNSLLSASNTVGTNGRIPLGLLVVGIGDYTRAYYPCVIKDGSVYKMWYTGYETNSSRDRLYYAYSYDGLTWYKYNNDRNYAALPLGGSGTGDDSGVFAPCVIKTDNIYKMWYTGNDGANYKIYYATSPDGLTWTKYDNTIPASSNTTGTNGRISNGTTISISIGDRTHAYGCSVILDNGIYKAWYTGTYTFTDIFFAEG